jgi:hypothetical protein
MACVINGVRPILLLTGTSSSNLRALYPARIDDPAAIQRILAHLGLPDVRGRIHGPPLPLTAVGAPRTSRVSPAGSTKALVGGLWLRRALAVEAE